MQLVARRPRVGYYDSYLWLPKTHVSEMQLRNALSYDMGRFKTPLQAWEEERDHYLVPRNFMLPGAWPQLPFKIYDTKRRSYPRVQIRSKIILDAKDPTKMLQRDANKALLGTHDGILCLRCGAGKTVIGVHSATQLLVPTIIIVNNKTLAQQWIEEIVALTDLRAEDIGLIGDGQFNWQRPMALALVQSLAAMVRDNRLPPEVSEHFGACLIDEAHNMGAPYFNSAIPPFQGRRWGLSATPNRTDQFDSLLKWTIGEVVYTHLEPELTPTVYFRNLSTRINVSDEKVVEAVTDKTGELHLQRMYGYLATDKVRLQTIVNETKKAVADGRQVLLLSQSRAMVEALGEMIPGAGVCHGGVKDRTERLRRIRECNPVIAIAQMGKEALNKPSLDTLQVCEPFSDMGVLQQIMGRVLRQYAGKKTPLVVFYDDVWIDSMHHMCGKIKRLLSRWPANQGGRIHFQTVELKKK